MKSYEILSFFYETQKENKLVFSIKFMVTTAVQLDFHLKNTNF